MRDPGVPTPERLRHGDIVDSIAEEFQAAFFRSRFVQLKSFALVGTSTGELLDAIKEMAP
jgi:hypothetical protein